MDNTLLLSQYIQSALEQSDEILDILYPEDAPHGDTEPEGPTGDTDPEGPTGDTGETEPAEEKEYKIFPLLQPKNLSFPFIVHGRTGIQVTYTKDVVRGIGWTNNITYAVSCVSDDYVQCIELANAVRHTLETYRYRDNDIIIYPIYLNTVAEYMTDNDAFVEELQFQIQCQ